MNAHDEDFRTAFLQALSRIAMFQTERADERVVIDGHYGPALRFLTEIVELTSAGAAPSLCSHTALGPPQQLVHQPSSDQLRCLRCPVEVKSDAGSVSCDGCHQPISAGGVDVRMFFGLIVTEATLCPPCATPATTPHLSLAHVTQLTTATHQPIYDHWKNGDH